MGKCLVIGSTVCDVMIYLDQLPGRQGDTHIRKQVMSLGGCAFNVVTILHHLGVDYDFISPVGSGLYGTFVKNELKKEKAKLAKEVDSLNDSDYVVRYARSHYIFSKNGEEVIILPENK